MGGAQTGGLVRVGETTRRPAHPRSEYVGAVLRHLESVGFPGAPRALGYDRLGRQVLSYVEGEAHHTPPHLLSDSALRSGTHLIRSFHDATAGSPLCGDREVVCHGDLGPHSTVFRGDVAVALIDFDGDLGPGDRLDDFAHAAWCFADLTEDGVPVADQARRVRVMCESYPGMRPAEVVEALTVRFVRARATHAAGERAGAVEAFDRLLRWMERHGGTIAGA